MRRITLALVAMGALTATAALAQTNTLPKTAPGVDVERVHKLQVGDRAPELAISEWIKGEPVTGFDKGRVYVVEFWATWCGPCIASMPHISELQKKYADKGVRIIGVQIWEEPSKARPFIETGRGADRTDYTIAIEEKHNPDDIRNGLMAKNWMKAAGRNGIPSAFLVDQNGYVAWIGHPMSLDEPLKEVVAGEWDIARAAKNHVTMLQLDKTMQAFQMAAQSGNAERAAELASEMIKLEPVWDNAGTLNMIAWMFVDPDGSMTGQHADMALKVANRAAELSEHKDAMILDTLAWAQFNAGKVSDALATQKKAVELATGQLREQLEQALATMQAMAKRQGGG